MKTNRDNCDLHIGMILDESPKFTEEEKREILEHEALVKELTESFEEMTRQIIREELQNVSRGCGHPAWED